MINYASVLRGLWVISRYPTAFLGDHRTRSFRGVFAYSASAPASGGNSNESPQYPNDSGTSGGRVSRSFPPQPNINTRTSQRTNIGTCWIGLLALAICILATACAGTDEVLLDGPAWRDECGLQMPGDLAPEPVLDAQAEEKRVLIKYMGRESTTYDTPCYANPNTHNCVALPYTKTFTWSWNNAVDYAHLMTWDHIEALAGFEAALGHMNSHTGFSFTQTAPSSAANHIDVYLTWDPDAVGDGAAGFANCGSWVNKDLNAPGQVGTVNYYKNCQVSINLALMVVVADYWEGYDFGTGYFVEPWGVGWAMANHEFGHVMGFAHFQTGGMRAVIPASELSNADFTAPQYSALNQFNPTVGTNLVLITVPFFSPHWTE